MLHAHLTALEREHQRLEEMIQAEHAAHNDNAIRKLKVQKLHLREEIERLKEEMAETEPTIH
jgi:hypothetical protein